MVKASLHSYMDEVTEQWIKIWIDGTPGTQY